jgi:CDP-glucose 4,6-dehydratase
LGVRNGGVDTCFWRGRRVLLTGHSGFKGAWLAVWLARLGAQVTGVALRPESSPSLFELAAIERLVASSHFLDIRDSASLTALVRTSQPDVVLHLAAQALVRRSYEAPVETFATNVLGTVHLLEALRQTDSVRAAVLVTTDKVYANREWAWPYRESDALGGHDPYSARKAACEIVIDSYRKAFLGRSGVRIASARAGNVIGGGDWSHDRLLPDAVRAWQSGGTLDIRRPGAVRPWQHVLEPLCAYLVLAQALFRGQAPEEAYNFGPGSDEAAPVRKVIELAQAAWGGRAPVNWGSGDEGPHEAGLLALEVAKARRVLGVTPRWTLERAVQRTMAWYRGLAQGQPAMSLCHADIDAFEAAALEAGTV